MVIVVFGFVVWYCCYVFILVVPLFFAVLGCLVAWCCFTCGFDCVCILLFELLFGHIAYDFGLF